MSIFRILLQLFSFVRQPTFLEEAINKFTQQLAEGNHGKGAGALCDITNGRFPPLCSCTQHSGKDGLPSFLDSLFARYKQQSTDTPEKIIWLFFIFKTH